MNALIKVGMKMVWLVALYIFCFSGNAQAQVGVVSSEPLQFNNLKVTGVKNGVIEVAYDDAVGCRKFPSSGSNASVEATCPLREDATYKLQILKSTTLLLRERSPATIGSFFVGDRVNVYGNFSSAASRIDALILRNITRPIISSKPVASLNYKTITTTSTLGGTLGSSFRATLQAQGKDYPSFIWSVVSGTLPLGLELAVPSLRNFPIAEIAGTPKVVGTFPVEIRARDALGNIYQSSFVIRISGTKESVIEATLGGRFSLKVGDKVVISDYENISITNKGLVIPTKCPVASSGCVLAPQLALLIESKKDRIETSFAPGRTFLDALKLRIRLLSVDSFGVATLLVDEVNPSGPTIIISGSSTVFASTTGTFTALLRKFPVCREAGEWDMGDGKKIPVDRSCPRTTSTIETKTVKVEHTYVQPGVYPISLRIGNSTSSKFNVTVSSRYTVSLDPTSPSGKFSATSTSLILGKFKFSNTSKQAVMLDKLTFRQSDKNGCRARNIELIDEGKAVRGSFISSVTNNDCTFRIDGVGYALLPGFTKVFSVRVNPSSLNTPGDSVKVELLKVEGSSGIAWAGLPVSGKPLGVEALPPRVDVYLDSASPNENINRSEGVSVVKFRFRNNSQNAPATINSITLYGTTRLHCNFPRVSVVDDASVSQGQLSGLNDKCEGFVSGMNLTIPPRGERVLTVNADLSLTTPAEVMNFQLRKVSGGPTGVVWSGVPVFGNLLLVR